MKHKTLFGLGVSRCRTRVVSDTDMTPAFIVTLNFVIFLNYYLYRCVSVCDVSDDRVRIRAS